MKKRWVDWFGLATIITGLFAVIILTWINFDIFDKYIQVPFFTRIILILILVAVLSVLGIIFGKRLRKKQSTLPPKPPPPTINTNLYAPPIAQSNYIYYQESIEDYRRRTLVDKIFGYFFFIVYPIFLIYITHVLWPIDTSNNIVQILILIAIFPFAAIMLLWEGFNRRLMIIREDVFYPPRVPLNLILKIKEYAIRYEDISRFRVTTATSGLVDGLIISHPDYHYAMDLYHKQYPIHSIMILIAQLRKKCGEKEAIPETHDPHEHSSPPAPSR